MFGIENLDSFEPRFLCGLAEVNLSSVVERIDSQCYNNLIMVVIRTPVDY